MKLFLDMGMHSSYFAPFPFLVLLINIVFGQQSFLIEPTDTSVIIGQTAVLQCSVLDKAGTLAWTKGGTQPISVERVIINPDNQARYSIVGDDATQDYNLQITDATIDDAGDYQCQVSASGSDTEISAEATLTVLDVPVQAFTTQPSSTTVPVDTTATLQCAVENKEGFLQWFKDGVLISNETEILDPLLTTYSILGNQAAGEYNLQILLAQEADEGTYQCAVTAAGLNSEITSTFAVLTISSSGQRLEIVPANTVAREGTSTRLLCRVADKAGVLTWLKDGQQISEDTTILISGSSYSMTGNQSNGEYFLEVSEVEPSNAGTYFCTVSGVAGDSPISSGPAVLTITEAVAPDEGYPRCSMAPDTDLQEGQNVTLTCITFGGEPQPKLLWITDDQETFSGTYQNLGDHARNDMQILLASDLRGVEFTCQSSHPTYASPQTCSLPPLDFELEPTITIELSLPEIEVWEDESISVDCTATGDPPIISYIWYYNGIEIENTDERFVFETTVSRSKSTLQIVSAVKGMDESVITCEARNRLDSETTYALIKILESDLYQIVLVAMIMIAVVVFVVIFALLCAPVFYRRHMKKSRVSNEETILATITDKLQHNFFVTQPTANGHVPNGDGKRRHKRHHKKHKKHKHSSHERRKSKVTDHEVQKRAEKKLKEIENDVIYEDPDTLNRSKKRFSRNQVFPQPRYVDFPVNSAKRDVELGRKDSTRGSLANGDALRPISRTPDLSNVDESKGSRRSSSRRSSRRHSTRSPASVNNNNSEDNELVLSPGEFLAKERYEDRMRELFEMRVKVASPRGSSSKRKTPLVFAST